ncbi:UDP-2,4-diacetamido-2,4,6-trideoxy-beta-L-altropyranose hydrolase [Marinomonas sp. THO17]|uniref:PseG/SpsG family protein n=1 Tax=Marinomonas sp. THO17 TaxID=3149048 RepID=UPI00336BF3AC
MKILIRADASVHIGMGHRVRCQALVSAFERQGHSCQFVVQQACSAFAEQNDIVISQEVEFLPMASEADLVILDHYGYQATDIKTLYHHQANLLVLDDMNNRGEFPAKWVLNPLEQTYPNAVLMPLTGSRYALLRPPFLTAQVNENPTKLLVTLGGTDPLALTLPLLIHCLRLGFVASDIVVMLGKNAKQAEQVKAFCNLNGIELHQGVVDVTPLMAKSKMAISAAGSTLFELACMGVPSLFVQVADNQTLSLEQHLPLGWCRALRFDDLPQETVAEQVERLIHLAWELWQDSIWQAQARKKARQLVDGKGADRVVNAILSGVK